MSSANPLYGSGMEPQAEGLALGTMWTNRRVLCRRRPHNYWFYRAHVVSKMRILLLALGASIGVSAAAQTAHSSPSNSVVCEKVVPDPPLSRGTACPSGFAGGIGWLERQLSELAAPNAALATVVADNRVGLFTVKSVRRGLDVDSISVVTNTSTVPDSSIVSVLSSDILWTPGNASKRVAECLCRITVSFSGRPAR